MNQLADWLEKHQMTCFYRQISGIDCPGCGMQRSFICLVRGDFAYSFQYYPALLPVLFTLTLTALHLFFKFKNGASFIKYSFLLTISIVVVSYIIKLIR